ncbi:MAG: hypothetical protein V7745_07600 [Pseudomonadales bacterium]
MADENSNGSEDGANGGGGEGNPAGGQTVDWTAGLSDETKGIVSNKGWKSAEEAIGSYKQLESYHGVPADRLMKLPGEGAEASEWAAIHTRLGRPENAEGYEIQLPEGSEISPERMSSFSKAAFDAGLSKDQVGALAKWDAENQTGAKDAFNAENTEKLDADDKALRSEWGPGYDRKVEEGRAAARQFGVDETTMNAMEKAMGFGGIMKFMADVGGKLGEDTFKGGREGAVGFNTMTPAEAGAKLSELQMDPNFMKKYTSGDKDALTRFDNLIQIKSSQV